MWLRRWFEPGSPARISSTGPILLILLILLFLGATGTMIPVRAQSGLDLVVPTVRVVSAGGEELGVIEVAAINGSPGAGTPGPVLFVPGPGAPASTFSPPGTFDAVIRGGVVEAINLEGNTPVPADGWVLSIPPQEIGSAIRAGLKLGARVNVDLFSVEAPAESVTRTISGFDRSRGTDELIVYRPGGGRTRTLTNQWGFEVVVVKDRVTSLGGNNQAIPADGFVLSGHGASADWLRAHAEVGQKVEIRGTQLTLTTDATTVILGAEQALAGARSALARAERGWADVPYGTVKQEIARAEEKLARALALVSVSGTADSGTAGRGPEAVPVAEAIRLAAEARFLAERALLLAIPSASVSLRGAWYRPVETSAEEIATTLDRFAAAGFNALFLEMFWDGRTLWPSDIGKQLDQFRGWDPAAVWVEEAHRRGIELHAWVHIFNVGERGAFSPGPIIEAHPDWALRTFDGSLESPLEPGLVYVDPAAPAVHEYLASLFTELVTKYPLDGFEFDYIRYPAGAGQTATALMTSEAGRAAYRAETGVDPLELRPNRPADAWRQWNQWRMQQVTRFVAEMGAKLRQIRPNLLLSAAVMADPSDARSSKLQDWPTWLKEGYLDFISAMAYAEDDVEWVRGRASEMARQAAAGGKAFAATGITTSSGPLAVAQAEAVLEAANAGVVFFAFNYADGGQLWQLRSGPFRLPASPPYRTAEAARRLGERIRERLSGKEPGDPLYQAARAHPDLAREVEAALSDPVSSRGLERLHAALARLAETTATAPPDGAGAAGEWLLDQIDWLIRAAGPET
ncbi:MAG TPA: family 10 glycosylhydrolase [Firmicutes bacterium]|nr:family 10 glycosylhydrolase [Bacillota bacterium]